MRLTTRYFHLYDTPTGCPRDVPASETGTRKGGRACKRCKSPLNAVRLSYGVIEWQQDNRYRASDVLAWYENYQRAEQHARSTADNLVVREFRAPTL